MKKHLILLLISLTLLSCSSSDDSNNVENAINPPSWIQGTWIQTFDNVSLGMGYKFSSNDICNTLSTTEICFNQMLEDYDKAGGKTSFKEIIKTDVEYKFSYTVQSVTTELHFKKGGKNTIYLVSENMDTPLTKK